MERARDRIEVEGLLIGYVPTNEYRIHPDDWAELLKAVKPVEGNPRTFYGLKIVLDHAAPRLPRKTR